MFPRSCFIMYVCCTHHNKNTSSIKPWSCGFQMAFLESLGFIIHSIYANTHHREFNSVGLKWGLKNLVVKSLTDHSKFSNYSDSLHIPIYWVDSSLYYRWSLFHRYIIRIFLFQKMLLMHHIFVTYIKTWYIAGYQNLFVDWISRGINTWMTEDSDENQRCTSEMQHDKISSTIQQFWQKFWERKIR